MNEDSDSMKYVRILIQIEAMQQLLSGFLEQIKLECCPDDQDQIAHKIAHLTGHFPNPCIHKSYVQQVEESS